MSAHGATATDVLGDRNWFVNVIDNIPNSLRSGVFAQSCDGAFIATVNSSNGIDILSYYAEAGDLKEEMELKGHRSTPFNLTFSQHTEPVQLISSANDYIIKWNITECLINQHNGVAIKGAVVMQCPTSGITQIAWNCDDTLLAICTGCDVILYSVQNSSIVHELRGHMDTVTCAAFCPHYDSTLVTASADRTYMIWNSESGKILYKSSIICSLPFEHLVMSGSREEFTLVSSDGMVRFYDISPESDFSQLKSVDLDKVLNGTNQLPEDSVSASVCVLCMLPLSISLELPDADGAIPEEDTHYIRSLFGSIDVLLILTSSHVIIINEKTGEVIATKPLTDLSAGYVSDVSLRLLPSDDDLDPLYTVQCVTRKLLDYNLRLSYITPLDIYLQCQCSDSTLSVISRVPVQADSPLRSSLVPKQTFAKGKLTSKAKRTKQKSGVVYDRPVVYRSKVRSSGYATTHNKRTMFQPSTKAQGKGPAAKQNPKQHSVRKVYPVNALPISKVKGQAVAVDSRPTQIMQLDFSLDGQGLAVACANSQAYSFKLPLASNKTTVYSGHAGAVQSCKWSYSGQLLVTSSKDKTVKLWSKDLGTPVITLNRLEGNMIPLSQIDSKKPQSLPGETRSAQFFYVDKFILVACANSLLLYKYHIDSSKDDIKRYENKSRYKLSSQQYLESAQNITSMSAANSFYSHLVLTTGSDRSIQVFDMNVSTQTTVSKECHSRPAHHITQNEGSLYSSLHYSTYDLFMTSAIGDGVKLWDLRTQSCIRKFESHVSKAFPCTCDFSPDGKYIASGSEDNSFYIYDIGTGKVVSKVKDPSAVCTNVAYHPLYTQVLVMKSLQLH